MSCAHESCFPAVLGCEGRSYLLSAPAPLMNLRKPNLEEMHKMTEERLPGLNELVDREARSQVEADLAAGAAELTRRRREGTSVIAEEPPADTASERTFTSDVHGLRKAAADRVHAAEQGKTVPDEPTAPEEAPWKAHIDARVFKEAYPDGKMPVKDAGEILSWMRAERDKELRPLFEAQAEELAANAEAQLAPEGT